MIISAEDLTAMFGDKIVSFTHEARKRGKPCGCLHQRFVIDERHGTVECADCQEVVSAFHAICAIAKHEGMYRRRLAVMREEEKRHQSERGWLRAVKNMNRIWRGGKALPTCPHCGRGLARDDMEHCGMVSAEIEEARRKKK